MGSSQAVYLPKLFGFVQGLHQSSAKATSVESIPLFYIANVIESGENAIETFQNEKGFRPPDGTVRAKINSVNYLTSESQTQIFYPLFPPHITVPIQRGEVILVMLTNLGMSKNPSADGYWLRPAVREPKVLNDALVRFDAGVVGNEEVIYGTKLTKEKKTSGQISELQFSSSE